jgi:hypothetical protein
MTNRVLLLLVALALAGCGQTTTPQPTHALDIHSDSIKAWHPAADPTKASLAPAPRPLAKKAAHRSIATVVTDYAASNPSKLPSKTTPTR